MDDTYNFSYGNLFEDQPSQPQTCENQLTISQLLPSTQQAVLLEGSVHSSTSPESGSFDILQAALDMADISEAELKAEEANTSITPFMQKPQVPLGKDVTETYATTLTPLQAPPLTGSSNFQQQRAMQPQQQQQQHTPPKKARRNSTSTISKKPHGKNTMITQNEPSNQLMFLSVNDGGGRVPPLPSQPATSTQCLNLQVISATPASTTANISKSPAVTTSSSQQPVLKFVDVNGQPVQVMMQPVCSAPTVTTSTPQVQSTAPSITLQLIQDPKTHQLKLVPIAQNRQSTQIHIVPKPASASAIKGSLCPRPIASTNHNASRNSPMNTPSNHVGVFNKTLKSKPRTPKKTVKNRSSNITTTPLGQSVTTGHSQMGVNPIFQTSSTSFDGGGDPDCEIESSLSVAQTQPTLQGFVQTFTNRSTSQLHSVNSPLQAAVKPQSYSPFIMTTTQSTKPITSVTNAANYSLCELLSSYRSSPRAQPFLVKRLPSSPLNRVLHVRSASGSSSMVIRNVHGVQKPVLHQANACRLKPPDQKPNKEANLPFVVNEISLQQKFVVEPNYKDPFVDINDVASRLLPYHLYQDFQYNIDYLSRDDNQLEEKCAKLLVKKQAMFDKYKSLMVEESAKLHSTAESVLLDRLWVEDETSELTKLRTQRSEELHKSQPSAMKYNPNSSLVIEVDENSSSSLVTSDLPTTPSPLLSWMHSSHARQKLTTPPCDGLDKVLDNDVSSIMCLDSHSDFFSKGNNMSSNIRSEEEEAVNSILY